MIQAIAWAASILTALGAGAPPPPAGFPEASPESVGLSTQALKDLDAAVQGYVDREETVGAELMVIKNRRTVWHTAHGLADREHRTPLSPGSIYCVRSMTKPFIGTAAQMLIDEGKLSLTDTASKYLPEFDTDTHRGITIAQLLTHTSGLPLSSLIKVDYKTLKSVQEVAAHAAKSTLDFTPGERFSYSDDGTDTLTAIIEKVSGRRAEEFIQDRILTPLGMTDSMPVAGAQDPRPARMIPLYGGSTGAWSRIWSPDQDPPFPYFLGSQALYSTCEDYARFLCLWADGGVAGVGVDGRRLLSKQAIERGLTPANPMGYPCGFTGLSVDYAQLWMTWVKAGAGGPVRVAFGHGGSDGTAAWMWPEQDLIVLYFTQSRGGLTSLSIEGELDKHLFGGASHAAQSNAPLVGVYWEESKQMYRAIVERGGKLNIEIPGQFFGALVPADQPDHWTFELDHTAEIVFQRGPDGNAASLELRAGGQVAAHAERVMPDATLPSPEELIPKVLAAHGTAGSGTAGVLRRTGAVDMPTLNRHLAFTHLMDGMKMRIELSLNGVPAQTVISDGDRVWTKAGPAKPEHLAPLMEEQTLLDHPRRTFGDWRLSFEQVTVIGRSNLDGVPVVIVRCIPKLGYPTAMLVNPESGLVMGQNRIVVVPGVGAVGAEVRYSDFREAGGLKLPAKTVTVFASPLLGTSTVTIEAAQEKVEAAADAFTDPTQER